MGLYFLLISILFTIEFILHLFILTDYRRRKTPEGDYRAEGVFLAIVSLALSYGFAFFLSGLGLEWLFKTLRMFGVWQPILLIAAVSASLILVRSVLFLPLQWCHTFVREQRHGFNTVNAATFWCDQSKSFLINLLLTIPLVCALRAGWEIFDQDFFVLGSPFFWIVTALATALFPLIVTPIFYKPRPLEEGALKTRLTELAQKMELKATFWVLDSSSRTTHSNAYVTGLGPSRRIVLYDTLVREFSPQEVAAVAAHELGHQKRHHLAWRLLGSAVAIALSAAGIAYLWFEGIRIPGSQGWGDEKSVFLTALIFLSPALSFCLTPLMSWISRRMENQADLEACRILGGSESLAEALQHLGARSKVIPDPHPVLRVYETHPHPAARLKTLRQYHPESF